MTVLTKLEDLTSTSEYLCDVTPQFSRWQGMQVAKHSNTKHKRGVLAACNTCPTKVSRCGPNNVHASVDSRTDVDLLGNAGSSDR